MQLVLLSAVQIVCYALCQAQRVRDISEIYQRSIRCQHLLLVCPGCHNKRTLTGWLMQQQLIFLQFWNLEDQGVSGVGFSQGLSPLLADAPSCRALARPFLPVHPWCLFVLPSPLLLRTRSE